MARDTYSSGLKAADAAILDEPGFFMGAEVISDETNAVNLVVHDHASAASGTKLGEITIGADPAKGALTQGIWFGPEGIKCMHGIFANITQASGTLKYYVWYRELM